MFVSKIKEMRIKRGKSQLELGKFLGLSQSEVSLLESGKRTRSISMIEKTSIFLDCCPYSLFSYKCDRYEICTDISKNSSKCINI